MDHRAGIRVRLSHIVGVETDPGTPDAQSFAQEGASAMRRELEATRAWFTSHPGFSRYRGNAIHDWRHAAVLGE